jgi:hypothetical protein
MNSQLLHIVAFGLILISTACKPKYNEPNLSAGDLNPERFLMIGDGHSGGYMDDAVYFDGQKSGLAVLLGNQLSLIGGESFTTNFVGENSMGANFNGRARLKMGLKEDCLGITALSPVRAADIGDLSIITASTFSGEARFRNFGIPGLRTLDILSSNYAQFNPFFARIASSNTAAVLSDALSTNPTFFALYLGLEDCMVYAGSGGTVDQLPLEQDFSLAYSFAVEQLISNGAKGILATIPDVRTMPYFRTIPYNGLNLDEDNTATLNSIFNPLGYTFQVGANPFTIVDPEANDFQVRQILNGELLLLSIPLDSVRCNQMGSIFPFRNEFVLTLEEQEYLQSKINAYNDAIRTVASTHNLAIVETDAVYQKLFSGFIFNGVNFSAQFVTGGAFSLDGIFLNGKGNAFLANEYIRVLNQHYNAKIQALNPGDFNGVLFP